MKQIIRIDKADGTEDVIEDVKRVERIVKANYSRKHFDEIMADFQKGERVATAFAYYELRDVQGATNA